MSGERQARAGVSRDPDVVPAKRGSRVEARAHPDARIASLAERQHGVVGRTQLLADGLTSHQIDGRVSRGALRPIRRGAYLVGHSLRQPLAREAAAQIVFGGVLSHHTAAWIWGIEEREPVSVALTVQGSERRRRLHGVRLHIVGVLDERDVRRCRGLRLTTPARTLIDLAATHDVRRLGRAYEQARVLGLVRPREMRATFERFASRRGARTMRIVLEAAGAPAITRSEAERRMIELIRSATLSVPQTNVRIHGYEVDMLWPAERLAVEIDGFAYHGTREAFERDRRRDAELGARGLRVLRVTWRQIEHEPTAVVARLAQALARG